MSDNIQLVLSHIDYTGERVQVTLQDGGILMSDKVLVTTSIGVLRAGDIEHPQLSDEKRMHYRQFDFTWYESPLKFSINFIQM